MGEKMIKGRIVSLLFIILIVCGLFMLNSSDSHGSGNARNSERRLIAAQERSAKALEGILRELRTLNRNLVDKKND